MLTEELQQIIGFKDPQGEVDDIITLNEIELEDKDNLELQIMQSRRKASTVIEKEQNS